MKNAFNVSDSLVDAVKETMAKGTLKSANDRFNEIQPLDEGGFYDGLGRHYMGMASATAAGGIAGSLSGGNPWVIYPAAVGGYVGTQMLISRGERKAIARDTERKKQGLDKQYTKDSKIKYFDKDGSIQSGKVHDYSWSHEDHVKVNNNGNIVKVHKSNIWTKKREEARLTNKK